MQTGERELHLGLDAGRSRDAAAVGLPDQILEQSGLPDARLTSDDQHLAVAGAHAGHHLIQPITLRSPPA
jgi:hypothetical protein